MKQNMLKKTCSLVISAVMLCPALFGTGLQCGAEPAAAPMIASQDDDTPVSVIVRVSGDAVMEQPEASDMGADYLDTADAAQQAEKCRAVQRSVQDSIRKFYPELSVGFSYHTLYNGFSCELPANLIAKTEALPDVVSVSEADTVQLPQTDADAVYSGFPAECDLSGYSGAGQVIAVIDSELDTSHPMFAPLDDDIETALTLDDIREVSDSGALHLNIEPDRAYLSNKLPYAVDYLDKHRYDGVPDPECYHGTHVSGIAAGNAFIAEDGMELSGIAKDAQLLFFACGKKSGMSIPAALAALEDAVSLHADVINMSWGSSKEYFGENPFTDAIAAADRAGIIVCNAAGNSDNGTRSSGIAATPDAPDTCTVCDKAELSSPLLVVASADQGGQAEAGMFLFAGGMIVYRPTMDSIGSISFLSQALAPGDYAYGDCGTGTADALRAANVSGKLALVQRTAGQNLEEVAVNAAAFNALGVIVIDYEQPDGLDCVQSDAACKLAVVTYEEGQRMLGAADKTVTFTGENVMQEYPAAVSSYTSWGVKHSLDLRPDIMGIGGRVRSAAYNDSSAVLSGTSMSSPYVAGCAAVLRSYLKDQGIDAEGEAFSAFIRRLLMNTAIPAEEDGLFVTPRRQGAGLVSMENAVSAKALMTGPAGEAKVNLFDRLGSSFSFDVDLTNFSDEDVAFTDAALCLTTDGTSYDSTRRCDILSGQQNLYCNTYISGLSAVGAGETETLSVQVDLDAAQYASLSDTFSSGFFIEGFLMLSGAENSADISIPVLGFSGDWAQVPIGVQEQIMAATVTGEHFYIDGVPLIAQQEIIDGIRQRVPDTIPWYERINLIDYATEDEIRLLEYGRNESWISPNQDGIADRMYGMRLRASRGARADLELTDADGRTVFSENNVSVSDIISLNCDQSALAEGDYTFSAKTYIDYPGSAEHPQVFHSTLHIDRTAPEGSLKFVRRKDHDIITVTVSDDRALQGVIITGNGSGSLAENSEHVRVIQKDEYWTYGTSQFSGNLPKTDEDDSISYQDLPYCLQEIAGFPTEEGAARNNYFAYISFGASDDGEYTFSFDVSNLMDYSVIALDNAYNYYDVGQTDNAAERLLAKPGIWYSPKGMYELSYSTFRFTDFYDGSQKWYSAEAKNNQLQMRQTDDYSRYLTVTSSNDDVFTLTDNETGEIEVLSYAPDMKSFAAGEFYSIEQLLQAAQANSAAYTGKTPLRTELDYFYGPERVGIRVIYEDGGAAERVYDMYYDFSLRTGFGAASLIVTNPKADIDPALSGVTRTVDLFSKLMPEIPAGLYFVENQCCAFLFHDDGKTGQIMYTGNSYYSLGFEEGMDFFYIIGEDGRIKIQYQDDKKLIGSLLSDGYNRSFHIDLTDSPSYWDDRLNFILLESDPEALSQLHSADEMLELGKAYVREAFGKEPDFAVVERIDIDRTCMISFMFGQSEYYIFADPITGEGNDSLEGTVNLLNPPNLPANSYSLEEIEQMVMTDFAQRDYITPDHAITKLLENGHVQVMVMMDESWPLECYDVDAVTGMSTTWNNGEINLPETGRNNPAAYYLIWLAILLIPSGGLAAGRSLLKRARIRNQTFV